MDMLLTSLLCDTGEAVTNSSNQTTVDDGTQTGQTEFPNNIPEGMGFVVNNVIIQPLNIVALITPPTISIGDNSGSFNNVVSAVQLTGIAANKTLQLATVTATKILTSASDINVNVTVAAVGGTPRFRVILVGVLVSL